MPIKASRRGSVPPFIVMDVMRQAAERAASGKDVLHLEVGQPGGKAPAKVIEAAQKALTQHALGYTLALGLPELQQRLADYYLATQKIAVAPERIVLTTGSSGAFVLAFLAAFDPGDRVVMAAPGYPAYRNILKAIGVEAVLLPADARTRFQPSLDMLDALPFTPDGLILASPSNPTGSMLPPAEIEALCRWCDAKGVRLISDEIYHGIVYGMEARSALVHSKAAVVINSFSKYFAMTGWRLGWMVLPEDLLRPVECLAQNLFIAPPAISQYAALAAFDSLDELNARVRGYAASRDLLLRELPKAGFDRLAPSDGAFYLYADIGHLTNDSADFCRRMLAETGVAATPGIDFDPERGLSSMRFSFAGPLADMQEAAKRLIAWKR
jgi:aspartate/methionine/tyrosine aminotransferase